MLSGQIYDMINKINLSGFKTALEELLESSIYNEMSFIDRISILLEREVIFRENKAIQRKLMDAKLKLKASLEDIKIDSQRGIDSNLLKNFMSTKWITDKKDVIIVGPTGSGKTFFSSSLAEKACRNNFKARYYRTQALLSELLFAAADGSFKLFLARLEKYHVLIIDDWALQSISENEQKYFFELIAARNEHSSTVFVSQTPVSKWHSLMPNSTIADAILDRIVHSAMRVELKGESHRKTKNAQNEKAVEA